MKQLLRTPKLLQFAQRVSSDFNLRPLSLEDVGRYIAFRLQAVGGPDSLFTPDACMRIAEASGGVPRIINILCDTALVYGYAANMRRISADLVEMIIEDKQTYGVLPLAGSQTAAGPVLLDRIDKHSGKV